MATHNRSGHVYVQRAQLLMEQARFELAEKEVRQALALEPDYPIAHALLGGCLSEQKRHKEALAEVHTAIGLAPHDSYNYYALAKVYFNKRSMVEAKKAIEEALRLEPDETWYIAMLAELEAQGDRWKAVLKIAEHGLQIDPLDASFHNFRGLALVKLNRTQEAELSQKTALGLEPDNAFSYANQGWTLLEQGQNRAALEYFREALRLEPEYVLAKVGLAQALKARYPLYRWALRFTLWSTKSGAGSDLRIGRNKLLLRLVAGVFLVTFCLPFSQIAFAFALFLLVLLVWTAEPIADFFLQFNRFGRLMLSKVDFFVANFVIVGLAATLVSFVAAAIAGSIPLLWLGLTLLAAVASLTLAFKGPLTIAGQLLMVGYAIFLGWLLVQSLSDIQRHPHWVSELTPCFLAALIPIGAVGLFCLIRPYTGQAA